MPVNIPACYGCGACCAYGKDWVEVTEADLKIVPPELVKPSEPDYNWAPRERPPFVMKTTQLPNPALRVIQDSPPARGERCVALKGEVGKDAHCGIYGRRPAVCSEFQPGSPECLWILGWYGLSKPW